MNKTYKKFLGFVILLSAILIGSCAKDDIDNTGKNVPVTLEFISRSVEFDYDEDDITSLRLIVFRAGQEKCVMNNLIYVKDGGYDFDLDTNPSNDGVFGQKELELPQGIYDFFLMANESTGVEDYAGKLTNVETRKQLYDITISNVDLGSSTEVGGYPSGKLILEEDVIPFPRSAYMKNVHIGNNVTNSTDMVSLDGGRTWQSELPLELTQIAAKFNIGIRKMTATDTDLSTHEKDAFYITDIRLLHIPSYAYMIPKVYDSELFNTLEWYKWDGGEREDNDYFTENNSGLFIYTPDGGETQRYSMSNREDVIIPEYLLSDPTNKNLGIVLELRGDYYHYVETESGGDYARYGDVQWMTPLNFGTADLPDYQTKSGNAYNILVTITQPAKFEFTPEITILVTGWDHDTDGYYNAGNENVSVSGNWSKGSFDGSGRGYVDMGDYVEYTFTFHREDGDQSIIEWKAVLTNPADFQLLNDDGAATHGYARPGDTYKVRVSPKFLSNTENTTKLYINIDDGVGGTIRLPINQQDSYTIIQNK